MLVRCCRQIALIGQVSGKRTGNWGGLERLAGCSSAFQGNGAGEARAGGVGVGVELQLRADDLSAKLHHGGRQAIVVRVGDAGAGAIGGDGELQHAGFCLRSMTTRLAPAVRMA